MLAKLITGWIIGLGFGIGLITALAWAHLIWSHKPLVIVQGVVV